MVPVQHIYSTERNTRSIWQTNRDDTGNRYGFRDVSLGLLNLDDVRKNECSAAIIYFGFEFNTAI